MKETIVDILHAGMEKRLTKSVHTSIVISPFLYSVIESEQNNYCTATH